MKDIDPDNTGFEDAPGVEEARLMVTMAILLNPIEIVRIHNNAGMQWGTAVHIAQVYRNTALERIAEDN